ncbi:Ig-like domain-containing protein, partial [Rhizobium subbaraonis]|uniref:Ig-like domain-containing protein n=1 Tax=Rhizobium subbaraonis TaxID=908946 RepID=UPI00159701F8
MSHISGTVDVLDLSSLVTRPASARNPDGSHVLAQAGTGASIVIHGFGPDGDSQRFTLEVNAAPVRLWLIPKPGEGETGYVLMWAANKGAGLFQQVLDASGQPVGEVEMLQDDNGAIPFLNAALSPLSNGNWLASYEHWDGLMLQMVDRAGDPVGDPVIAPQFIYEYTAIPDGEGGVFLLGFDYEVYDSVYFAYHYDAQLQLLSFERLWVTNYASIATPIGPGESVTAYVESNQLFVTFTDLHAGEATNASIFDLPSSVRNMTLSLTQLSDGDILATWTRAPQGETPALQGLRINADGSLDGAVFDIAAMPDLHTTTPATVTALPDGDFSIAFITSDGGSKQVRQLSVDYVGDAPEGLDATITLLEDGVHVFAADDFQFSDANNDGLAAIEITALPEQGTLLFDGAQVAVGQFIDADDIDLLVYRPDPDQHGTDYASIDFKVIDASTYGSDGSRNKDDEANTITFDVTAVDDIPTGKDKTVVVLEDESYGFTASDFGFSDADGQSFAMLQVTSLPPGLLLLEGRSVSAGERIAYGDIAKLVYMPAADASGIASFTFQVIDQGTSNNIDPVPKTFQFEISPVNDAPSGTDRMIDLLEDRTYTFKTADFGFTDKADGHALAGVKFTTLPTAGTLTLSGKALKAGQIVSSADLGKLVYTPTANATAPVSFTFQVIDNGGKANDGIDTDPTANAFRFSIKPVNDAPTGADKTIELLEDSAYKFKPADFGFTDTADGHVLAGVKFAALPSAGSLTLSGKALKAGQIVASADLGKLVYTPAAHATAPASFSFQVIDNGGRANGGIDTDPTPNAIRFSIKPVNDAPSGTDRTVGLLEDKTFTFKAADFGFNDKADGHTLAGVKFATLPTAGTLTLSGKALKAGQIVAAADLGKLVYTPTANATAPASFTFQVIVNGGKADGGIDTDPTPNAIRFSIKPVNDAPSGADKTVGLLEDKTYTFKAADFGFTDKADGHVLAGVKFATLPTAGTLTLSGKALKAGQIVASADLGKLVYTPAAHATAPASFSFQVIDNGGKANGGIDTDPTPNAIRFSIKPVNDAPSGTDRTVGLLEDKTFTFKAADFGFNDKADGHTLAGVKFATLPTAGTLTLSG